MSSHALEYLLLIFGGCLGIYQIAAAAADLKGLWFFKKPSLTYLCGFLILGSTFGWFFGFVDLKMNADPLHPEVEGAQQLGFFLLGSALALMLTFGLSSLIHAPEKISDSNDVPIGKGLEDLKYRTVAEAFSHKWKNRRGDH